ncbi:precorrin-6Y C5,15-methyltransferase (decarboxylating) subunit CbiT [Halobaculum sp. CBA1158]|uniref:precorrin-6Y C5,15-methyltransferase (decarboxylating) subunit CbiT n=1 Tax=Halobaculum sp. CBA1158 TaxID=2904243 RepID=UPI001F1DB669|nr:precorrin-6Y C5,15-methyltransferase (decarboxylating) subunit CbiT [Halobaculum sp. CBA1158]UIP01314.1 precorrin-6Y C5,15-methyltransferase (decarboxylating) subunit CbiT [Halobaculum sp. CBA1158]
MDLPHDAKAGPTKPEVRAVTVSKLGLTEADHFVEVGSCTGAVTVLAARRAGRVTALERKPERLEVTERNLAANGIDPTADRVDLVAAEAPEGLPADADALFLGGSRNFEAVLDHAVETGVRRVVMNVSRLEVAGRAVEAFRERDILDEVIQLQASYGYELAGATSFDAENPVYVLTGGVVDDDRDGGGESEAVDDGSEASDDAKRSDADRAGVDA